MSSKLKAGTATSGAVIDADTTGILELQTGSTPTTAVTITAAQNVGIGTASPTSPLHVAGSSAQITVSNAGVTQYTYMLRDGYYSVGGDMALYTGGANNQIFYTNATERMRIDSSGNVLVGTTSNNGRISANGSSTNGSTNTLSLADSGGTNLFYVRTDGLINTGTKSASPYNNTTGSAANMVLDSQGTLYRSTSSIKYKTDIQDATHGLAELLQLRPVTYKGKAEFDGNKVFGGLIAEEVDEIGLIEFVQYADDGSPDALAYGQMVALCIKSIQELNAKVDAQALEIQALKGNA